MSFVNEEFLDAASLQFHWIARFVFNDMPMVIEATGDIGMSQIYKADPNNTLGPPLGTQRFRFETRFNKNNGKAQIIWDGDIPDDIDIRIAADVMVAKFYKKLLG